MWVGLWQIRVCRQRDITESVPKALSTNRGIQTTYVPSFSSYKRGLCWNYQRKSSPIHDWGGSFIYRRWRRTLTVARAWSLYRHKWMLIEDRSQFSNRKKGTFGSSYVRNRLSILWNSWFSFFIIICRHLIRLSKKRKVQQYLFGKGEKWAM